VSSNEAAYLEPAEEHKSRVSKRFELSFISLVISALECNPTNSGEPIKGKD
jgi:hypothetical protein